MKNPKSRKSDMVLRIPAFFVTAVLFVVFLCLFLRGFDNYSDAGFLYSHAGKTERIFLAALALSFFILLYRAFGILIRRLSHKACRRLRMIMWLCFFLLQVFFLFYIRSYYKWDSGFVIGGAASLVENGSVADEAYYYLSVYPNQNTFVLITALLIRLCNFLGISAVNRPLVFNLFNTVCMDISVFLVYRIIQRFCEGVATEKEKKCRILLLLFCNPFLYLGVSYYYTITLSWPFTVGFLYFLMYDFRLKPDESTGSTDFYFMRWILSGILLGIGFELRATAVIFAIAAFLIGALSLSCMEKRFIIKTITILAAAVLSSQLLAAGQRAYIGIDTTDTAFPATHWVMMSLTEPGGHNAEDESFTASFATKEEKEAAIRNRIEEKLQTMGIRNYARLIGIKISRTFGDGMNGYTTFLADGYGTGAVYDCLFGEKKDFVILWHQGYYLFLMLGMLYAVGRTFSLTRRLSELGEEEYKQYKAAGLYILILFGAVLFYTLWEASEQYSVPFMPVMLCLAAIGFLWNEDKHPVIKHFFAKSDSKLKSSVRYLSLLPAILFAVWAVAGFARFTSIPYAQSRTAAVQILANMPFWVDDEKELVQELTIKRPFNHLVLQWRNPIGEENDAEYEVLLCSADGQMTCMRELIRAAEAGNNGAGIYTFDRIDPSENGIREYEIRIRKTGGSKDNDLQFVLYDMYGYIPYPGGNLLLRGKENKVEKLTASLLFLLSEETEETYSLQKKYIFFTSCLFLIFLFMGICCKIEKIGAINDSFEETI